jgi:hypothetical protein
MKIPQLPADKANHIIYGAIVALVAMKVARSFHGVHPNDFGLIAAAIAGVGKELVDAYTNYKLTGDWRRGSHTVDAYDALATASGGLLVWAAGLS